MCTGIHYDYAYVVFEHVARIMLIDMSWDRLVARYEQTQWWLWLVGMRNPFSESIIRQQHRQFTIVEDSFGRILSKPLNCVSYCQLAQDSSPDEVLSTESCSHALGVHNGGNQVFHQGSDESPPCRHVHARRQSVDGVSRQNPFNSPIVSDDDSLTAHCRQQVCPYGEQTAAQPRLLLCKHAMILEHHRALCCRQCLHEMYCTRMYLEL